MSISICSVLFISGVLTGLGLELALSLIGYSIYKIQKELERC